MKKSRILFIPIAIFEYLTFQNVVTSGIIWTGFIYVDPTYSVLLNAIITASLFGTVVCVAYDSEGISDTVGIVFISSCASFAILFLLAFSNYILFLLFHYGTMLFIYNSLPRNKYKLNSVIINRLIPDLKNKKIVHLSTTQDSSLENAINSYAASMIRKELGHDKYSWDNTEFIVSTSSSGSPFFIDSFESHDDMVDWLSHVEVYEDKTSCIHCTKLENGNIKFQGLCKSCFSEISQEIAATDELAAQLL